MYPPVTFDDTPIQQKENHAWSKWKKHVTFSPAFTGVQKEFPKHAMFANFPPSSNIDPHTCFRFQTSLKLSIARRETQRIRFCTAYFTSSTKNATIARTLECTFSVGVERRRSGELLARSPGPRRRSTCQSCTFRYRFAVLHGSCLIYASQTNIGTLSR